MKVVYKNSIRKHVRIIQTALLLIIFQTLAFTQLTIEQVTDVSMEGACDGQITILASGNDGPFEVTLLLNDEEIRNKQNVSGIHIFNNLCEGDYTVILVGQIACTSVLEVSIRVFTCDINFNVISLSPVSTCSSDCQGESVCSDDGSILIGAWVESRYSLNYSWVGPNGFSSSNKNIESLESGLYSVTITVTDIPDCFIVEDIFLPVCENTGPVDPPTNSDNCGSSTVNDWEPNYIARKPATSNGFASLYIYEPPFYIEYILKDFEDNIIDIGKTDRAISYPKLLPGIYTFEYRLPCSDVFKSILILICGKLEFGEVVGIDICISQEVADFIDELDGGYESEHCEGYGYIGGPITNGEMTNIDIDGKTCNGGLPTIIWQHEDAPCQEPITVGNYLKVGANIQSEGCTDTGPDDDIIPEECDSLLSVTLSCDSLMPCESFLVDIVELLVAQSANLGGDDLNTPVDESIGVEQSSEAYEVKRQLYEVIAYANEFALRNQNFALAERILSPLQSWHFQKQLYGLQLLKGSCTGAREQLEKLDRNTEEQKDFYFTQLLNLDRIEMNFSAIDSSRIADLKRIAQKNHPGMGYAWSLYY